MHFQARTLTSPLTHTASMQVPPLTPPTHSTQPPSRYLHQRPPPQHTHVLHASTPTQPLTASIQVPPATVLPAPQAFETSIQIPLSIAHPPTPSVQVPPWMTPLLRPSLLSEVKSSSTIPRSSKACGGNESNQSLSLLGAPAVSLSWEGGRQKRKRERFI